MDYTIQLRQNSSTYSYCFDKISIIHIQTGRDKNYWKLCSYSFHWYDAWSYWFREVSQYGL